MPAYLESHIVELNISKYLDQKATAGCSKSQRLSQKELQDLWCFVRIHRENNCPAATPDENRTRSQRGLQKENGQVISMMRQEKTLPCKPRSDLVVLQEHAAASFQQSN
uniref:Uncharacterized protein n=1 Tax=Micrurus spixii TaxID=129469 RepID=A0A2D4NF88_9SAUR